MFKKRYLFVLILILLAITGLSAVSANDLNTTDDAIGQDSSIDDVFEQTEDTYLEGGGTGTFTELNQKLSSASVVDLDRDYSFSEFSDESYRNGITIDGNLTINGHNHKICGNGARTFIIGENAIVNINDLIFTNNNQDYIFKNGGTIYNDGLLYLSNCQFLNSTASENGGAIFSSYGLFMTDCRFHDNAAINSDETISTTGGSICNIGYLRAEKCNFTLNYAKLGGAISNFYYAYIVNSLFFGNQAEYCAGAVYNEEVCLIESSTVRVNFAEYGGAVYNCQVNSTLFEDNSASQEGNNMYWGLAVNCSGKEDIKDYVNVVFGPVKITTSKTTIVYGEKLVIKLTDATGVGVPNAPLQIKVKVGSSYKYFSANTDSKGYANIPINVAAGTYANTLITIIPNTILETNKIVKLVVKKATPKITASKKTFKSSVKTKQYTIILKDNLGKAIKNANVKIKINGKTFSAKTNSNGKAIFKITKLTKKGNLKATITYAGNSYYNKATKSVIITIN